MTFPKGVVIPNVSGLLLLVQTPFGAVSIYASVYVFGTRTAPFVLAVVTASLHCLLSVYCYATRAKARSYHIYIVNSWPVVCIGLGCGALYYFARSVRYEDSCEGPNQPLLSWTRGGCAMSSPSIFFDLLLVGVFNRGLLKQAAQQQEQEKQPKDSLNSPAATPVSTLPPQVRVFLPGLRIAHPTELLTLCCLVQLPPLPKLFPEPQHSSPLAPALPTRQQSEPFEPDLGPEPDILPPKNRITLIVALCNLQHPDGHWPYTPELATVLRIWAGGRGEVIVASDPGARERGTTALARACLTDLAHYVWRARREGREYEMLDVAELGELERLGWDLKWVAGRIVAAGRWLRSRQEESDERARMGGRTGGYRRSDWGWGTRAGGWRV